MTPHQVATTISNHFDPSKSHVVHLDRRAMLDTLGVTLTASELIVLAGAPVGSIVTIEKIDESEEPPGPFDPPQKVEGIPAGLLLTVQNSGYIAGVNKVVLFNERDDAQSISIYVKLVMFHPRALHPNVPKGVGALMLRSMLDGARNLAHFPRPFAKMTLMAAGGRNWGKNAVTGDRWSGYAVWPKYGFDAAILAVTTALFPRFPYHPENLSSCRMVSELLALAPGGPEFWHMVGDGWYMDFDMSPGSTSESRLSAFLGALQ